MHLIITTQLQFTMDKKGCVIFLLVHLCILEGCGMFVDRGIPYNDGPLEVGELTVTVIRDSSPKHVKVFYPLKEGDYAVVYFLGGLRAMAPAEVYSVFLNKLASHGFFVFGVDAAFPLMDKYTGRKSDVDGSIDVYFRELDFLIKYMTNRTTAIPRWDYVGLMCHSSGCDITLRMIEKQQYPFISTAFLEPDSKTIRNPVNYTIPALMYATQLAAETPKCNTKGDDFEQYYAQWKCPRIALEVADFGHCDILDPLPWEGCHITHACKTTNNTRLDHYRQFVQGVAASFFVSTLQGRQDVIQYIVDPSKLVLKCLVQKSDINCGK